MLELFNKYFEIIEATTEELKQEHYKIRYQVYIEELKMGFDHNNNMEMDKYDNRSIHFLVRHKSTNQYVATCRLIYPTSSQNYLPIATYGKYPIDSLINIPVIDNQHTVVELSRTAVPKTVIQFRKSLSPEEREASTYLFMSLIAGITRWCIQNNVETVCGFIDPILVRKMKMIGFNLDIIGESVDVYGLRTPTMSNIPASLENIKQKNYEYWRFFTNETK